MMVTCSPCAGINRLVRDGLACAAEPLAAAGSGAVWHERKEKRLRSESNRRWRICNPLP